MKTPIWPYIAVVACLFVLSLLAPHAWLRPELPTVETSTADTSPELTQSNSVATFVSTSHQDLALSEPGNSGSSVVPPPDSFPGLPVILQNSIPAQVAPVYPPVGEQVRMEDSVPETPDVPTAPNTLDPSWTVSDTESLFNSSKHTDAAPLQRQAAETVPGVAGLVPSASALIDGLRELSYEPHCREWAEDVLSLLEDLHQTKALGAPGTGEQFQKLLRLLSETPRLADKSPTIEVRANVLRLGYAVKRRVDIWHQVHKVLAQGENVATYSTADMKQRLKEVEEQLSNADHADEWRRYLLLAEVREMTGPVDAISRSTLAKRVLKRIDSPQLSRQHVQVFENSPFKEFSLELRRWASEPIDYLRLIDQIEEYEKTGSTESSRTIARTHDVIRWSPEAEPRKLAELLNTHYRNANVRVALTADFFNRLLPESQSYQENVSGNIAGANFYGTSHTVNRLQVILHPDRETWHIGLEAHGEVNSDTAASKGPATFYNQGFARYYARKQLMVDRRGIRVWRAETNANSETELTGFETNFDPIPIIGWLARSVARSQHDQKSHSAKVETEEMVRNQAGARFDDEVHERLATAEQKVKQKLIAPFEKIDLKPTALEMSTTEQRVIARYRLAGDSQLGAQTPRPQAPADSLLSVQIHESALNNTLSHLRLEGKRSELRQLYHELAVTFEQPDLQVPEDVPEGVVVQFADEDAIRVHCDDGRIMLTIRFAELKRGRSKWNDFSVRAFYVPDSNQLNANLVRDGEVQIIGEEFGERLPLRVIFSKLLSKSRAFNLVNKRLVESPAFSDCHVNQFVINDGWIGVGVGPNREQSNDQVATKKKYHVEDR